MTTTPSVAAGADSGREAAFGALLTSHAPAFRRIARAYGTDPADADDLHQEILLQLWRALPGYRGEAAAGTWGYRVALNTALTWRRRAHRQLALPPAPPASDTALEEERLLEDFCAALRPADRAVLLLFVEGLDHAAIGEALGLSTNAVSIRLHRIKAQYTARYLEE